MYSEKQEGKKSMKEISSHQTSVKMVYAQHENHNQIFIESEILPAFFDSKEKRGF